VLICSCFCALLMFLASPLMGLTRMGFLLVQLFVSKDKPMECQICANLVGNYCFFVNLRKYNKSETETLCVAGVRERWMFHFLPSSKALLRTLQIRNVAGHLFLSHLHLISMKIITEQNFACTMDISWITQKSIWAL